MKTVIEMAREAGWWTMSRILRVRLERFAELVRADERERIYFQTSSDFVKAAIAEEREQIAQMIEAAPPLVQLAQNEHGGCLMCGFTPKLAAAAIRARRTHEQTL